MKKSMKLTALVLALVLVFAALCGCGKGNSLEAVQKEGVITVATSPDFPPFESLDGDQIVGIEVDIMQLIAEELGVEVQFEQMDFDSVLPGVQAGKFDVGMSGITITEEREKNADFTMPYFMASQAIVVMADSDITCKADLEGKTIAVQTGTTAETYCMENGYDVQAYQANNDAASALTSGKVDAWVVDNEVAIALSAEQNGATIVLDEAMTSEPYAFAFVKDSDTLVQAFNEVIEKLVQDGTIEAIFEEYGVTYVAPEI
jgi:ABC-type amino acid transport substrate-binding protein